MATPLNIALYPAWSLLETVLTHSHQPHKEVKLHTASLGLSLAMKGWKPGGGMTQEAARCKSNGYLPHALRSQPHWLFIFNSIKTFLYLGGTCPVTCTHTTLQPAVLTPKTLCSLPSSPKELKTQTLLPA